MATFLESFLDTFAFGGVFHRSRRESFPTQVFATDDVQPEVTVDFPERLPDEMVVVPQQSETMRLIAEGRAHVAIVEQELWPPKGVMVRDVDGTLIPLVFDAEGQIVDAKGNPLPGVTAKVKVEHWDALEVTQEESTHKPFDAR